MMCKIGIVDTNRNYRYPVVFSVLTCSIFMRTSFAETLNFDFEASADGVRVLYNGADASSFVSSDSGYLSFEVPFPDSPEPFRLEVLDLSTGGVLHEGDYRVTSDGVSLLEKAGQGDFDVPATEVDIDVDTQSGQVSSQLSAQLDLSGIASDLRGSDYPESETEQDGESDLLASVNVSWASPSLEVGGDFEAVHRSNPDNSVRFNGPRADLSRMVSSLRVQGTRGASFNFQVGDVNLDSPNSLVNTGMASRGFIVGFNAPNNRFSWSVGRLYGHDIVGAVRGPLGFSDESYRIATNYNFKVADTSDFTWDLSVTNLRAKRTADEDFSIGASNSGERNSVWGVSNQVGLFDGRVNLTFSVARSKYDNPDELNFENIPSDDGFEVFDPGMTSGNAYRHSISWNAYNDFELNRSLTLEYGTERADPFYRSIHGESTADRRQWSLFSSFSAGMFSGRLGTTQFQNNLDNLISIHTLDEALHQAEVSIDLTELSESGEETSTAGIGRLIPSNISLNASIEDLKTLNGEVIILAPVIEGFDFMDQTTETYGISATWDIGSHSTSVDLSYSFLDIDQRERASADRRDVNYGISHSVSRDNWSVSASVSTNRSDDLDSASRSRNDSTQWGLSLSYYMDSGVNWSASLDSGTDTFNYLLFDEQEDTDSNSMSISVDYGSWLGRKLSLEFEPTMSLRWHRSENDSRSTYYSSDQVSESISFNMGVAY